MSQTFFKKVKTSGEEKWKKEKIPNCISIDLYWVRTTPILGHLLTNTSHGEGRIISNKIIIIN